MLTLERALALRYLRSPLGQDKGRFLKLVLYVAVGGVAAGVATLVLALAVVRGFSQEIEAKIVGFGAHVQVESLRDEPLDSADVDAARLRATPGVRDVAPAVLQFVLLRRSATAIEGVSLWGVEAPPPFLVDRMRGGHFTFAPDTAGRPGLVVGQALARTLGLEAGDPVALVTLPTPGAVSGAGGARLRSFHVAGVYETSLANLDELYVFAALGEARRFLGLPDGAVSRYDLTLADVNTADAVAARVEAEAGPAVQARTVFDLYGNLFAWVDLQQQIIPLVLAVIVVVAAFNIVGILLMLLLEKTGDVGILGAMGARPRQIRRAFLLLGAAIGLAGSLVGGALAVGLAFVQARYGLLPLPSDAYFLDRVPMALHASDVGLVTAVAVGLCLVAAYFPARVAARLAPVRVLRFR